MGSEWHAGGRLLEKRNTFTDFIDVTRHLVEEGYCDGEKVFASGGSAGGLLMGAVANMAPELYTGVVARAPFVDVVTTMLDPDLPLTVHEYEEWGNPAEKSVYDHMCSYSPYDCVSRQAYPGMLVTAGLHDASVQYWEPAKWVAKLRDHNAGDSAILLRTAMEAGHAGPSGRYEAIRDLALEYAFIFDLAGIGQ